MIRPTVAGTEEQMTTLLSKIETESKRFGLNPYKQDEDQMVIDNVKLERTGKFDDLEIVDNCINLGSAI